MKPHSGSTTAFTYSAPRQCWLAAFGAMLRTMAVAPVAWLRRRYERRAVLHLSDHLLRDLGLPRSHAWDDTVRPYWRGW